LKDAQSGVAEGSDEWDRLQREIIETEQNLKSAQDQMKDFGSVSKQQLDAVADKFEKVGKKMSDVGTSMSKVVTGPIVAVGAASLAAWAEVDEAMDGIIQRPGRQARNWKPCKRPLRTLRHPFRQTFSQPPMLLLKSAQDSNCRAMLLRMCPGNSSSSPQYRGRM
jgi:flagellar hook-basal body complex protein FliE